MKDKEKDTVDKVVDLAEDTVKLGAEVSGKILKGVFRIGKGATKLGANTVKKTADKIRENRNKSGEEVDGD